MTNKEKYDNIFMNIFDVNLDQLNDKFTFEKNEDWDSFTHLTLIGELENTFDIMLDSEDILNFGGYLNGMEILKKYEIFI